MALCPQSLCRQLVCNRALYVTHHRICNIKSILILKITWGVCVCVGMLSPLTTPGPAPCTWSPGTGSMWRCLGAAPCIHQWSRCHAVTRLSVTHGSGHTPTPAPWWHRDQWGSEDAETIMLVLLHTFTRAVPHPQTAHSCSSELKILWSAPLKVLFAYSVCIANYLLPEL